MTQLDKYYAYKFIYLLTQRWEETKAYELGIIDGEGNELKKIRELKSQDEKRAYTKFHKLVFKLKKMLDKVPMSQSTIGRFATAIRLIKEETECSLIEEEFSKVVELPKIAQLITEELQENQIEMFGYIFEDVDGELELVDYLQEFTGVGGIEMGARPVKKKVEESDDVFAGNAVFNCDSDTFQNCRLGKRKYLKYKTYVGEDEVGERIRQYGRQNPSKGIILKDSRTGAMLYLRRGK